MALYFFIFFGLSYSNQKKLLQIKW